MPAVVLVLGSLAGVLTLSGVAKLPRTARRDTRDAIDALRVPWLPRGVTAAVLPWLELGLAVALLAVPAPWLAVPAVAALGLMLAYAALIARALGFGEELTCSCFGRLLGGRVDSTTLVRNLVLVALSGSAVAVSLVGHDFASAAVTDPRDTWLTVLAAGAVVVLVAVMVLGTRDEPDVFDYVRQPIPYAVVADGAGGVKTLRALAAGQAQLLVMLNRNCAPCERTADQIGQWATALEPVVAVVTIYPEDEPDLNVRYVFGISGAPAAVLLGADGLLAGGPVAGEKRVAELVEDVRRELGL